MNTCEILITNLETKEKHELNDGVRCTKDEKSFGRQLFACASPIISAICFGMTFGVTGTLLPQIQNRVDEETGSWLAGCIILSMPVGNVLCTFTMRSYGRKTTLVLSHLPWIIGWIYLSFSREIWSFLLGAILIGFSAGFNAAVGLVYTAETCEPRLRGLFLGFSFTSVSAGILVAHALGISFDWKTALRICAAVPSVSLIFSIFAPESSTWLVLHGRLELAKKNFFWLRGNTVDSEREFRDMLDRRTANVRQRRRGWIRNLFSFSFLKPFYILMLLFTVQEGSGLNVIIFYAMDVLQKMSTDIGAAGCTILIDVFRFAAAVISCFWLRYTRRRIMYFLSAACTILSLMVTVAAVICKLPTAVLLVSLCSYIWSLQTGIITIPLLMNSEIYPAILRDVGSVLSTAYACFATFIVVKTGPFMFNRVGLPGTLSIYATIVFVGAVLLYFVMPETKNVTLQEAEDKATKKKTVGTKSEPICDLDTSG